MTAKQIIDRAKSQIGVCENPPNSNNVIYNTWYYGHPVSGASYPWCAVFISWLFKAEQSLCVKTASCVQMLEWFEKRGQLVKTPQAGDIVFFNKDGSLQHFDGDGNNVTYSDEWWSYRLETSLEDFIRNGTSESFYPEYGTGFMLGCAYSYFSTLEISTNEMRISGQCGGENYELVFVPAP